jgi:hypothetical protein
LSAAVVLAVVASLTAVSAAPAGPSPPVNEAPPVISPPYPVFGTTLTATPGTWSGEDTTSQVSYAWERYTAVGWSPIAGATGASYTVTPADQGGLVVRVTVTADSGAVSTTADSAAVAVIGPYPPAVQSRPVVSGQGVEGGIVTGDPPEATLVVSTGTWSQYPYAPLAGSLSFSYQWLRARNGPWTSIPGATAASYTIQPADWGYSLSATVTATDLIGASSAPSQNSVGVQPPTVTDVGSPFQSYIAGDPYLIRTPASGYCFGSTCVEEPVSTLLRSNGFTQRLTVKRRSKMLIQWIVQRGRREITLGSESAVFPRPGRYRCRFVLTRRGRALLRSADTLSFTVVGWLAYRQGPNDDVTSSQSRASVTPEHQIAISPVPEAWDGPAPKTF